MTARKQRYVLLRSYPGNELVPYPVDPGDPGELFDVVQIFADDVGYERVLERVGPKEAVECAKRLSESLGGRMGAIHQIIITDAEDNTCFLWVYGQGVVFPRREGE
jgi:hypothetical protein